MAEALHLALLGGLHITQGDVPLTGFVSNKAQALLCYLAVTGRPHPRPALARLLWGDMAEEKASTNLRQALSNLRKLVGDALLVDGHSVALDRQNDCWLDVEAFGQGVAEALCDQEEVPAAETISLLARAVALYQGDLLDGFYVRGALEFEEWVLAERERLREMALQALYLLAGYHSARGENAEALDYALRLLALDPWREDGHRQVMRLLARSGRRSAALAQYESCRRLLAKELGVEPMPETTDLYQRIRAATARRLRLPPQPIPFVGREDELARLAHCFDDPACRLLTLVGPGGIGKTRLAIEMARIRHEGFIDGVYFAPLAGVASPDLMVPAMADALHFSFYGRQDPAAQLLAYLREKELLLVLDSFEHLIEDGRGRLPGTAFLSRILQGAPQVKLLVTSRARLGAEGEWLFRVGGLPYPEDGGGGSLESYGAVRLFVQTASRVWSDFSLAQEGSAVVRICRLVEGMPLALELAAGGVWLRACKEIATEIEQSLDLLSTAQRDVPERHRSVRAAFEGSWRRLGEEEQRVLRQLSVFCGGLERAAARQVAGATRRVLDALVTRSLLREGGAGYQMHELLRHFAADKLAEWPEEEAGARARHGAYYVAFVQGREEALRGREQRRALAEIGAEFANVRAAWQWAVAGRRADAIARALEGVYQFYRMRGRLQEGREALADAVPAAGGDGGLVGRILARQAWFDFHLGHFDSARDLAEQSLALLGARDEPGEEALARLVLGVVADEVGEYDLARTHLEASLALFEQAGDRWGMARTLDHLGDVARMVGQYELAEQHYARCLALCQESGDQAGLADAYNSLGSAAGTRGDYHAARSYFEQSLAICRELDDRFGIAGASHNLGTVTHVQGDYQAAKALRQETLSICREIGFRWGESDSLRALADACRHLGEFAEAQRLYEESLALKREIGHQRGVALTLISLGDLAQRKGDHVQARAHYRQALQVAIEIQSPPVILTSLLGWGEVLAQAGQQEQAVAVLTFVVSHPAAEQQLHDQVSGILPGLKAALSPDVADAAEARGRGWTLDEIVAYLGE